jgi:peroxiredoxin
MRLFPMAFLIFILFIAPSMTFALSVGDKAPGFEAPSTHGNVILAEYKEKKNVVLAIYYADFTPV